MAIFLISWLVIYFLCNGFNGIALLSCEGGRNRVCFLDDEMIVPFGTMRATGDFVTVEDGEMFFLGRKDSQIKRHGKRLNIELVQQVELLSIWVGVGGGETLGTPGCAQELFLVLCSGVLLGLRGPYCARTWQHTI